MKKYLIKARTYVLIFLTHKIALPLIKILRKPNTFSWEMKQLETLPEGSLGNDLYHFLNKRNFPLLKHYARHDLKHVLLEYDTSDEGEVCLQSFMLGNGRVSFPVLATVLYGFFTMPEHWKKMKLAYKKGKRSTSFHHWKWNNIMEENTNSLRNVIFQKV
ncbi:MAG: hypothetical protein KDB99_06015 [Chitinophagaceae bacterium]|nr:hypothetical protein [Chitinophagaceae bacterium]MCB9055516.1 hypothetical protein [Chitinophagales bacterium]